MPLALDPELEELPAGVAPDAELPVAAGLFGDDALPDDDLPHDVSAVPVSRASPAAAMPSVDDDLRNDT